MRAISLPLIQIKEEQEYSVSKIRSTILEKLKVTDERESEEEDEISYHILHENAPSHDEKQPETSEDEVVIDDFDLNEATPFCPVCSGSMVVRKEEFGADESKEFWCCVDYQDCRGSLPKDF